MWSTGHLQSDYERSDIHHPHRWSVRHGSSTRCPDGFRRTPPPAGPVASVTPTSVDFGSIVVGASSDLRQVTFQNVEIDAVTVSGVVLGGSDPTSFEMTDHCSGIVLAYLQTCLVDAIFVPSTNGPKTATIEIESDSSTLAGGGRLWPATGGRSSRSARRASTLDQSTSASRATPEQSSLSMGAPPTSPSSQSARPVISAGHLISAVSPPSEPQARRVG